MNCYRRNIKKKLKKSHFFELIIQKSLFLEERPADWNKR